jgi:hypothetical protein
VPLAGLSLAPIAFGDTAPLRDPNDGFILTETHDLMRGGIREVGARNATHKVLCSNAATAASCEFYDLVQDPLEEYPLAKPDSCAHYGGRWSPADPEWHFCRLADAVAKNSFL